MMKKKIKNFCHFKKIKIIFRGEAKILHAIRAKLEQNFKIFNFKKKQREGNDIEKIVYHRQGT